MRTNLSRTNTAKTAGYKPCIQQNQLTKASKQKFDYYIFDYYIKKYLVFLNYTLKFSPEGEGFTPIPRSGNKNQDMIDWLFEWYPSIVEDISIRDLNDVLKIICPFISPVLDLEKLLLNHTWPIINYLNNKNITLDLVNLFLTTVNRLSRENAKQKVKCDLIKQYKEKMKRYTIPESLTVANVIHVLYPKLRNKEIDPKFKLLIDLKLNEIITKMSFKEKMELVYTNNPLLFLTEVADYFNQAPVFPLSLFILSFIKNELGIQIPDINDYIDDF